MARPGLCELKNPSISRKKLVAATNQVPSSRFAEEEPR
jgi:hypothetical protein